MLLPLLAQTDLMPQNIGDDLAEDLSRDWQRWLNDPLVAKLVEVALVVLVITVIVRIIRALLPRYVKDGDLRYRLRKGTSLVGYGLMALFTASILSDNLGQLTVAFGFVGAGTAFALQEVIVSVAGWVAISLGQFYKPGDRVLLGGIKGDVIDISLLRTTLMECGDWVQGDLYNGRIVRIANSFVFKEPVFNYSADFAFVWDEIRLPISYGSDYALVRQLILEIAQATVGENVAAAEAQWAKMTHKYLIENASVEPAVSLVANDNWVEFTLRYVVSYKTRRRAKDELFLKILEAVEQSEGKISFASATFQLVEGSALNVRLDKQQ